jgi:hypothetical protein
VSIEASSAAAAASIVERQWLELISPHVLGQRNLFVPRSFHTYLRGRERERERRERERREREREREREIERLFFPAI